MIGAMTTFAHDFFITPSDSKRLLQIIEYSDQVEALIVFAPLRLLMCKIDNKGGGSEGPLSFLSGHGQHEHSFRDNCGECK